MGAAFQVRSLTVFTLKVFGALDTVKLSQTRQILLWFGSFVSREMCWGSKVFVDLIEVSVVRRQLDQVFDGDNICRSINIPQTSPRLCSRGFLWDAHCEGIIIWRLFVWDGRMLTTISIAVSEKGPRLLFR